ncbi:hypothetical protein EVA_19018 [gut metagenome]|uniref:Uncharacterized protein n=1 Tax=gut metagenome TaxID=749906 RepID=J9BZ70_9ZZZZ
MRWQRGSMSRFGNFVTGLLQSLFTRFSGQMHCTKKFG